jgi:hypothetical protein
MRHSKRDISIGFSNLGLRDVIRITCSDARSLTQPLRIWRKITFEQV